MGVRDANLWPRVDTEGGKTRLRAAGAGLLAGASALTCCVAPGRSGTPRGLHIKRREWELWNVPFPS